MLSTLKSRQLGEQLPSKYPAKYPAEGCERQLKDGRDWKQHLFTHDGIMRYECNICGAKFQNHSAMRRHVNKHSNKVFVCEDCDKYKNNDTLIAHQKKEHPETFKRYTCSPKQKFLIKKAQKRLKFETKIRLK
jgi:uncharacterized Zn-finger protein